MKQNFILALLITMFLVGCGNFKKGYKKYEQGKYDEAIQLFKKSPDNTLTNFYTGQAYRKSNRLKEAEKYYAKVKNDKILKVYKEDHEEDAKFYYPAALEAQGKREEAQKYYEEYAKKGKNALYVQRAKKEIQSLAKVEDILKIKNNVEVKNCEGLNTPNAEFAPVPFGDKLLFSSARKESVYAGNGQPYLGLYTYNLSELEKNDGTATIFHKNIAEKGVNEATATISKNGKSIIFARGNTGGKKGAKTTKLYISELMEGEWSEPVLLEGVSSNDNEAYYGKPNAKSKTKAYSWDSSPILSPDGQTLYFSSDREYDDRNTKTLGRNDLYSAKRKPDGTWSDVRNLGASINTEGDDMFPFVSNEGKLYFSSDGHPSLGGLDIFVATRKDGKTEIKNLGQPYNSTSDDFGLVFTDENKGFFASNRENGKGDDDIYSFIDNTPRTKKVNYLLAFKTFGIELDKTERILPNTKIKLYDDKEQLIKELFSDAQGKTQPFAIDEKTSFVILADQLHNKQPYLADREGFTMAGKIIPQEFLEKELTDTTYYVELKLQRFEKETTKFDLSLLYDYNKWDIRPDAARVLDGMIQFLKDNPEVLIELGSHTDSRGSFNDNELLAQRRAQSAVDYIVSKGNFNRDKIAPKGYGENTPKTVDKDLADRIGFVKEGDILTEVFINSFREEKKREILHQINRRTEVIITGVE